MTGVLLAVLIAVGAGLWAGLLALAEESPAVSRIRVGTPDPSDVGAPYQVIFVARLALLLIAGVAASWAAPWWRQPLLTGATWLVAILGFLYMVTEALPRSVAALAADVAAAASGFASRSVTPFRPLLALARTVERPLESLLPVPAETPENIGSLQRDLLLGLFSLEDTTVSDIMTPRLDIDALESGVDWNTVVDTVRRSEHARLPVYTESLDRVDGILYAKDLVAALSGRLERPERWQDLIRPAQFVPESKSLAAQLRDFQIGPAHLALVVDEFGGTSGVVTLEDTIEEIVGEIHDEYDVDDQPAVRREGEDKFWVDGTVTVDELEALLGTEVKVEDVSTVGGFVYAELGRVPTPGETFRYGDFRVVVEQVVRRRIRRVYFERRPVDEAEVEAP